MDFILWQYKKMVLPAAQQYVVPSRGYADLVVESTPELAAVEKSVYDAIVESRVLAAAR